MKQILRIAFLFVALAGTATVRADIAPEKRAEIEKMLQLTGMERIMNQMKVQMIGTFKSTTPDVPEAFWNKLSNDMNVQEVIERLMPVYDKYYSVDDLKAVNAFYSSPAGQRVLATLPQVMKESMVVGQTWGKEMGEKAVAEIKAEQDSKAK